jgi:glycosyltransferase involved in cell wall biosynthesis
MVEQWRWAERQRSLFDQYAAIVVASEHMRSEYVRSGVDPRRARVVPLFPTELPTESTADPREPPAAPHVAFLGRMTRLKGGELLIRAVGHAAMRLGVPIRITMMGDGPQRAEWEKLARDLSVPCVFTGWLEGVDRWKRLSDVSVLALPSVWPEPFGLVGLEAGALGIPTVALASGGVGEWLHDGVNGVAVGGRPSATAFGDALAALFNDRTVLAALGAGARRVAAEMSLARHLDRLEAIFHEVVGTTVAA